jgi:hypothetical protein
MPSLDLCVQVSDVGMLVAGRQDFQNLGSFWRDDDASLNEGGTHLLYSLLNIRVCGQWTGS